MLRLAALPNKTAARDRDAKARRRLGNTPAPKEA
jgi:hypothetical protein